MKKEIGLFFTALRFYTRLPCPPWDNYSDEALNQSTRYFPLIGWIAGGVTAGVVYGFHFIFPGSVCIVLALAAGVWLTGAFHEDGFTDVCDGFGGGWAQEKILDIMKDSRIGAYGATGLFILFALKIVTLTELLAADMSLCLRVILFAHVASRFCVVTMIFSHQYAGADASSKVKPIGKKISAGGLFFSALWLLPFWGMFHDGYFYLFALVPAYLTKVYLARYFTKWIGGYTGDCLGATQQITEMVILLFCLGLSGFMALPAVVPPLTAF
ncbi:adenosylcobinamide-GDP ribazoletransferase [Deltaproteobacteria bacterium]|nr:adenosylcobinamide-GDP ribazoletransferase [Deltaproteobacteria bacterium]